MSKAIRQFLCVATALMIIASVAQAKTVSVNCGSAKIMDAVKTLDPMQSNVIRVSGTCNEFVWITDFAQLSIVASNKGAASVQGPNSLWIPLISIVRSHVQLNGLTLNGGSPAVLCQDSSVCTFIGNTIENGTTGVSLINADATFFGDVIQDNIAYGVATTGSRVRFTNVTIKGTSVASWDWAAGLSAGVVSSIIVEGMTIDGTDGPGILLGTDSSLSSNIWTQYGTLHLTNNNGGGIWVGGDSTADLSGAIVTNNLNTSGGGFGAGVVVLENSMVSFWNSGATITGNDPIDLWCVGNGSASGTNGTNGMTVGKTNCY